MTDTIHTVTLTPQEQAAYASGWNRAIEAAAKVCREPGVGWLKAEAIRALSMPAPALNMEVCGKCMGTGTAGHPDSGYTCDCDGGMIATPAQAWRVKPLVWAGEEDDYAEVNEFDLRYLLMDPSSADECNGWYVLEESTNTVIEADGSIEAAKDAAQADYAARILAALIPDTEGGA